MRKTNKKKLILDRETVRALSKKDMTQAAGGSDNSECYCPGYSEVNSCVAMCGI
jgi:natural product precursor